MDKASLVFCTGALACSLLVAVMAVPFASISKANLAAAKSVLPAEEHGLMDLGDFGEVEVLDLANYYAENPPVRQEGAARKVRFEGC